MQKKIKHNIKIHCHPLMNTKSICLDNIPNHSQPTLQPFHDQSLLTPWIATNIKLNDIVKSVLK